MHIVIITSSNQFGAKRNGCSKWEFDWRRWERTPFEFSEQCLSKFLALVLHDMSCRMPKYCRGDRFSEEDGNCGLFFSRQSNRPLVWELDIRNPPKFFEDVLFVSDCFGMDLLAEGFEHGRWTRLPKESRRYGETWTGSASAVMVIVHARTHAHREHADVPSTSGKSFCLSRQTPSTCPNTEKK